MDDIYRVVANAVVGNQSDIRKGIDNVCAKLRMTLERQCANLIAHIGRQIRRVSAGRKLMHGEQLVHRSCIPFFEGFKSNYLWFQGELALLGPIVSMVPKTCPPQRRKSVQRTAL